MVLPDFVVIFGPSGCGKSTIAKELADAVSQQAGCLGVFHDADENHTAEAKELMRTGKGITEEYRWAWLDRVQQSAQSKMESQESEAKVTVVIACSALRLIYRQHLLQGFKRCACTSLCWVFLRISPETAQRRVQTRTGHFFADPDLVRKQFDLLESPVGSRGLGQSGAVLNSENVCSLVDALWTECGLCLVVHADGSDVAPIVGSVLVTLNGISSFALVHQA